MCINPIFQVTTLIYQNVTIIKTIIWIKVEAQYIKKFSYSDDAGFLNRPYFGAVSFL